MGEKWREVGSKKDEMGREIEDEGEGEGGEAVAWRSGVRSRNNKLRMSIRQGR